MMGKSIRKQHRKSQKHLKDIRNGCSRVLRANPCRKRKLLGRGSDITGAILAKMLQAESYENWTDVSGIMMADPRIIDHPKIIEEISLEN